jgi:hypothetical protein
MTSITIKEYYAAAGSRYSKHDAEIIGPALADLAAKGPVTAQEVADVARSSNSPLHRFFEWDDKKAANLYRTEQARNMLRSIKVKYVEDGAEKVTRAFQITASRRERDGLHGYSSISVMHGDRAVAVHMMRNAMRELQQWKERYEAHQDDWERVGTAFIGVFNQISEASEAAAGADEIPQKTNDALAALISWRHDHHETVNLWSDGVEQLRYLYEAVSEAERAFEFVERKHVRKCMRCAGEFVSDGPGNRLCGKCRDRSEVAA